MHLCTYLQTTLEDLVSAQADLGMQSRFANASISTRFVPSLSSIKTNYSSHSAVDMLALALTAELNGYASLVTKKQHL